MPSNAKTSYDIGKLLNRSWGKQKIKNCLHYLCVEFQNTSISSAELVMPSSMFTLLLFKTLVIFPLLKGLILLNSIGSIQFTLVQFSPIQFNPKQLSLHIYLSGIMLGFWEYKNE